jgi:ATP-dependent protease HslVU (ClpYQ) peptidase subunit
MGCDSCASSDEHKVTFDGSKLFKKNNILFGYAGSFRFPDIIQYHTEFPEHTKDLDDRAFLVGKLLPVIRESLKAHEFIRQDEVLDHMALIGYRKKLYQLSSDFSLIRSGVNYAAIGSGMSIALGSLYTTSYTKKMVVGDRLTFALSAAEEHARGVAGPFHVMGV